MNNTNKKNTDQLLNNEAVLRKKYPLKISLDQEIPHKNQHTIELLLTCPYCDSTEWTILDKEGAFVCAECGRHEFPENMGTCARG